MQFLRSGMLGIALAFMLASGASGEGSGPGGSQGGMEGGAQSSAQGGENGAEIDHAENTGSGIVKGRAADTGPHSEDEMRTAPVIPRDVPK